MKVSFIFSQTDSKFNKNYTNITSALENSGNKVSVIKLNEVSTEPEQAKKEYQKIINSIKKSDFIVIETSVQASIIGFLMSTAINEKKPILALSDEKLGKDSESFWNYAIKNKLLSCKTYSLKNINEVIAEFLNSVKKIIDTKFILIISPEIDSYLEWASDNRRMHKAQVVRRAVEEIMSLDKEYKKFITSTKK